VEKVEKKYQKGSLKDALLHILDPEQNKEFTGKYFMHH
jgi:ATP-dependent Lon protease